MQFASDDGASARVKALANYDNAVSLAALRT